MIDNKRILKYQSVIKIMYDISIVVSFLLLIEYIIQGAVTGKWNILGLESNFLLPLMYFCGLFVSMLVGFSLIHPIMLKIDCAKIFKCVYVKSDSITSTVKIRILNFSDRLKICILIIIDVVYAFFSAVCNSAFFTNGYFVIIFARVLGGYFLGHFFAYLSIIFYVLCCNIKKKELRKDLPTYIENKKKEIIEKQKSEKSANDRIATQKLLEQCGMKFFVKYYNQIKKLPIRDIEVEENYDPTERTERLQAAKTIIDCGYSAIAREYILQNYSDILSDMELEQLKSVS